MKKGCPFHHRGLDAKVGSQEIPGITGNYKLRQAKANRVLPRVCTGHSKHPLQHKRYSTHIHHQMVNTEIRLIIFFAVKDGEALYSQQKQDLELTVAQILSSLYKIQT